MNEANFVITQKSKITTLAFLTEHTGESRFSVWELKKQMTQDDTGFLWQNLARYKRAKEH